MEAFCWAIVSVRPGRIVRSFKAFSGYHGPIRRIWGRPLGGKAVLEVIQHQGTPEETHRRETIVFDRIHMTSLTLAAGRRTSAEYVPATPPANPKPRKALPSGSDVLNDLRALASGDHTRIEESMRGSTIAASNAVPSKPAFGPDARTEGGLMYQTKLAPVAQTGVDVIAQVSMEAGGNSMRVKLSPVFQGIGAKDAKIGMNNPVIPGLFQSELE